MCPVYVEPNSKESKIAKASVLVIAYNRPHLVKRVLTAVEQYKPERLYLACDGPKKDCPDDMKRVTEVREAMSAFSGSSKTQRLFQRENLGITSAPVIALDWFFSMESQGIVLEDDCLPTKDFFEFMNNILEAHNGDPSVMGATGFNPLITKSKQNKPYYFVRGAFIWGWCSWRRAWLRYSTDLSSYPLGLEAPGVFPTKHHYYALDWQLSEEKKGPPRSWDYQWNWTVISSGGLWAVPSHNLIHNLGSGETASHTVKNRFENLRTETMDYLFERQPLRTDVKFEARLFEVIFRVYRPFLLNGVRDAYRNIRKFFGRRLTKSLGAAK